MLVVEQVDPRDQDIRVLVAEVDEYQRSLYPAESCHLEPIERMASPEFFFVTARLDGMSAGIGSYKRWGRDYVEIKRVYVRPAYRGQGIARRILLKLESQALAEDYTCLRLETGIRQEAAIELYQRLGYKKIDPFGSYDDDPLSVFMEKCCQEFV